jgi:tetratricopeptide (TPR) repeat protein
VATRGIAQAGRFTRQAVIAAARSARAAARALASLRWRGEAPRPEPQKVEEVETDPNAEELRHAQQRLAAKKRRLGDEHPDVAAELHLIGALHHEAGRYGEAVASYNEALVIRERTLGPNHCEVAAALEDLAATRREQGDSQEADALLERAGQIHAIYEEMLLQGEAAAARSA